MKDFKDRIMEDPTGIVYCARCHGPLLPHEAVYGPDRLWCQYCFGEEFACD